MAKHVLSIGIDTYDWVDTVTYYYADGLYPNTGLNKFYVTGVPDMVSQICNKMGNEKINTLFIFGHGKSGKQRVSGGKTLSKGGGTTFIGLDTFNTRRLNNTAETYLPLLKPRFSKTNGKVKLVGCEVGFGKHGSMLLQRLSIMLGVPVSAGTVPQNIMPGFEGTVVTANGQQITKHTESMYKFFR
jgi:hypothetical protein